MRESDVTRPMGHCISIVYRSWAFLQRQEVEEVSTAISSQKTERSHTLKLMNAPPPPPPPPKRSSQRTMEYPTGLTDALETHSGRDRCARKKQVRTVNLFRKLGLLRCLISNFKPLYSYSSNQEGRNKAGWSWRGSRQFESIY
jgi:hypothetical protein